MLQHPFLFPDHSENASEDFEALSAIAKSHCSTFHSTPPLVSSPDLRRFLAFDISR